MHACALQGLLDKLLLLSDNGKIGVLEYNAALARQVATIRQMHAEETGCRNDLQKFVL